MHSWILWKTISFFLVEFSDPVSSWEWPEHECHTNCWFVAGYLEFLRQLKALVTMSSCAMVGPRKQKQIIVFEIK